MRWRDTVGPVLGLLLVLLGGPLAARGAQEAVNDVGLDPGHSDADVGAVGGGLREVDLTLALARQIRPLLEAHGLRVALTREDNRPLTAMNHRDPTERIRLEQEARIAAVTPARIYVSIHFNGHPNPAVRGTETYYNPDNFGAESRQLAEALQTAILAELHRLGYEAADRGVRADLTAGKPYGHFFSLRGPQPSVLVEALFLSNPQEAALLREPATLEALARGYAVGILQYFAAGGSPLSHGRTATRGAPW
ncbi:MAG TPA: N-acetylmuramoyl-L-alanine amidase [Chloroflexota bacterium]|jgi:N-acetylmuramoyl-L-alanine amidase|nr:N-acetylmuramoyl-L-alanine amidase [Chloroflexota bacterium]